jgi:nucleoside-diphosphate-sugar epimerase
MQSPTSGGPADRPSRPGRQDPETRDATGRPGRHDHHDHHDHGRPAVVVLGGTGFVGRTVCPALAEAGYDVRAIGRRAVAPPAGSTLIQLDAVRAAPGELADALRAIDPVAVVNAAGTYWAVGDRRPTADELAAGNLGLVERLVEALTRLDRPPRLIHLGSTYEYGPQPPGPLLTEDTPELPQNDYGQTKLGATRAVRAAVEAGRLDAVVLRLTTTVGAFPPPTSLFGKIALELAAEPARLRLPALAGERDFVDVRDVAAAVLAAIQAPEVPPLLNIASAAIVPVAEAVDLLIKIAGLAVGVERQPPAAVDPGLVGSQRICVDAARERLGWEPRYTLADSLSALWGSVREG